MARAELRWSLAVSGHDDDRFRVRPGAPRSTPNDRTPRFISRVLREAGKAGAKPSAQRSALQRGRGHVAARLAGQQLGANARRVVLKSRYLVLKQAGARSLQTHLRYIQREGVERDGSQGQAYGPMTDEADLAAFEQRCGEDRHQFRFIVSAEDAQQLLDLRGFTRQLMGRMEGDLGSTLDWVAVDHWNTDNPHTHIVLRGKDARGHDLLIARDYIAHGMRQRACALATEWLGPRSEHEIQATLQHEVAQERWTGLDRALQQRARDGWVDLSDRAQPPAGMSRSLLMGRLQRLTVLGLAEAEGTNRWRLRDDAESILRAMGERGDILRTMQRSMKRSMKGVQRELAVFSPSEAVGPLIGRVTAKGLADELYDRAYLIVDGVDGRAHYVALPAQADLGNYPVGAIVEAWSGAETRAADRSVAVLAVDGLYRPDQHLTLLRAQARPERQAQEIVTAHVRRLEALRRAGMVERLTDGAWRVPADLAERGRVYDAQRIGGTLVQLRSHLPIERQARVIGATWLDQQLLGGGSGLSNSGFGAEVRDALRQRADFLTELGLAERRGQRLLLARDLLATLRGRELDSAARAITAETGKAYRPVADGATVSGTYSRNLQLVSGRFAMLDDGLGFTLVPWKPVIEQRLGQSMTATLSGGSASWQFGRSRGPAVS